MRGWICARTFEPALMEKSDILFAKRLAILNGAVPAALLLWDASRGQLGVNPTKFAIHTTGTLALIFLILSLAITPVRKLTGENWIGQLRRSLGLYAFFYAAAHLVIFFVYDRAASFASTWHEVTTRAYLVVGIAALLMMTPLAITSTDAMIRRLGSKRWKTLHKLAYAAAVAAVLHFYMQVKADVLVPLIYGGVLAVLLAYRLLPESQRRRPAVTPAA